jgi:transcriptional regulator with XRE-family HTH domain
MKADQSLRKLGDTIRKHRANLGVSQEAFADQVGMHRTYYSAVERGERNITLKTLLRIAQGLKVRLEDLMADANM